MKAIDHLITLVRLVSKFLIYRLETFFGESHVTKLIKSSITFTCPGVTRSLKKKG